MRKLFAKDEESTLIADQIEALNQKMKAVPPDSDEYSTMMNHVKVLYDIKGASRRPRLSMDTVVITAGQLLSIGMIIVYEQRAAFISKGIPFIVRPKPPGTI